MLGSAPPWVAVKVRLLGVTVNVEAALTVNVTGTETVVAPVALRLMKPVYVPAVSEPDTAVTVTVLLLVPEVDPKVSQVALSVADQVRVPPPVLLMLSVWAAGLLPA